MFKVAIVGKQNVGKSTLFNKIVGSKKAITLNQKGVTRDVIQNVVVTQGKSFILLDTAGFHPKLADTVDRTIYAIKDCDLILFIVGNSIDSEDAYFANWLRKNSGFAQIALVQNKIDLKNKDSPDIFGFDKVFYTSAEKSSGIKDLMSYIAYNLPKLDHQEEKQKIKIAILGRPNVGKSTLMNKILGQNRSLVQDLAGTTRDTVSGSLIYGNMNFEVLDTAGLRKKAKVIDKLEYISNSRSIDTISGCDVVLFVFDISNLALERQDFIVINKALERQKPVILVANKIDKLPNSQEALNFIKLQSSKFLLDDICIFAISSLHDKDFSELVKNCHKLFAKNKTEIKTHQLNKWLISAISVHPHPIVSGHSIKFRYATKVKDKQIFIIMCNRPALVKESYIQYLRKSLAKTFDLCNIPIKIKVRQS